jgi:8-oxo-dGTP diphosphatase
VGAIVLRDRDVLLVKRGHQPLLGRWTLPGGALELGESLADGVRREVREETGVEVEVKACVDVVDHIASDQAGAVEYHYVIVDYWCRPLSFDVRAGDDVAEAAWVPVAALAQYRLTAPATAVIDRAVGMYTAEQEP